jgi:hypothetical protein
MENASWGFEMEKEVEVLEALRGEQPATRTRSNVEGFGAREIRRPSVSRLCSCASVHETRVRKRWAQCKSRTKPKRIFLFRINTCPLGIRQRTQSQPLSGSISACDNYALSLRLSTASGDTPIINSTRSTLIAAR